jgi:tryptophanyl-tRNA synthetase
MKKRLLSGVKPTGKIHIGNYFGAMRQFVEFQDEYENFIFIADYHALNQIHNPKELSQYILEVAKAYLAIGLDPKKTVLFRQSDIGPVIELCWIFNCITSMALLKRAHAYKDALAKGKPINMGLFDYPVLMAADILIYKSDVVPIGRDQQQHLEITREIAKKFNRIYGNTFKIPQGIIKENVAEIKGLDGRKMSKSYKNTIELFDNEKEIERKIMSIVTDSRKVDEPKNPEACNIFSLHKLFTNKNELDRLRARYREGSISYKESKELLIANINKFLKPIREKKQELDRNPDYVINVLKKGKEIALEVANKTLKEVKTKIGL